MVCYVLISIKIQDSSDHDAGMGGDSLQVIAEVFRCDGYFFL